MLANGKNLFLKIKFFKNINHFSTFVNPEQSNAIINRINLQLEEIKNSNYKVDQVVNLVNRLKIGRAHV